MKNICIFGVSNGVGISRDINIIKSVLSEDYNVEVQNPFKYTSEKTYDMSIFLERFSDVALNTASPINIFIPNQEWFQSGWFPALKCFVSIFTKTKFADEIFKNLDCQTEFISFTSEDRKLNNINKDFEHWIHIAGKSVQKQTDIVWQTWQKNPGFPQLTIIQDPKFFKNRPLLRNVNYMYDRLPDDTLKVMQNSFGVHVCPSLTEGFGHYIMEAMSCNSVVITTNAAPMNEFINENNGTLTEVVRQEKMGLSLSNIISVETLEKSVIQTLILDNKTKNEKGNISRQFYETNDLFFKNALKNAVKKYLD